MAMDKLPAFGPSIKDHAEPTFKLYFPLLAAKVSEGAFLEPTEHRYGPLERHAYDVYLPSGTEAKEKVKLPTIVFVHGGGMVQGDKQIQASKGGAHRNVGTFFANKGYMVVSPLPASQITS
jgi:acetyl esterase/lipase